MVSHIAQTRFGVLVLTGFWLRVCVSEVCSTVIISHSSTNKDSRVLVPTGFWLRVRVCFRGAQPSFHTAAQKKEGLATGSYWFLVPFERVFWFAFSEW